MLGAFTLLRPVNEYGMTVTLIIMKAQSKFHFPEFLKHFIWGSCFGALAGLILWLMSAPWNYTDRQLGIVCVAGMALLLGLLAAIRRGRFWKNAIEWLIPW